MHLASGAPQAVLTIQLHAGAVGHVVQVVLHPAHGLQEVLPHLTDEGVGTLHGWIFLIVLVLQQLVRAGEVADEALDISLLLFRAGWSAHSSLSTSTPGRVAM